MFAVDIQPRPRYWYSRTQMPIETYVYVCVSFIIDSQRINRQYHDSHRKTDHTSSQLLGFCFMSLITPYGYPVHWKLMVDMV